MKTIPQEIPRRRKQGRYRAPVGLLTVLFVFIPFFRSLPDDAVGLSLDLSLQVHKGQRQLRWPSAAGVSYDVEARTNLSRGGWTNVAIVNAPGTITTWTDAAPFTVSRFYRVSYQVPEIVAPVILTHSSQSNGIPDLATATFTSVRSRLKQMAAAGQVALPVPMPSLAYFDSLLLSDSAIQIDDLQRAVVLSGHTTLRGQAVDLMFVGAWADDTNAATGFTFGVKFPQFHLTNWVSGLSGTALDQLNLDNSVITLATAPLKLNLTGFAGNAAAFYGAPTLTVQPGLNICREVNLTQAPGLAQPLAWLGFTDTTVTLEGFLGVDPNALFHVEAPTAALALHFQATMPTFQSSGLPNWLKPVRRILDFTNDPALQVRLLDVLEATPDGQSTLFTASTDIAASGGQTSVTLAGGLTQPWIHPFGISWLTFDQASLSIQFSSVGAGQVALTGQFAAGNKTVTTDITLSQTGNGNSASFVATVDQLNLGDVLQLFSGLTGAAPFGANVPDDALVLSNVQFSFNSSDERSVTLSATSTILGGARTDVLFSFAKPESGLPVLVLGLHMRQFKLSALYSGINGSFAGDLEFPDVAFTVVQEVGDSTPQPVEIPSGNLDPTALKFYQPVLGSPPFVLQVKAGVNFGGTFAQSTLPPVVLDALGMDPNGKVLLEGALGLRLGALTGGSLVALDSMNLTATLPPPARPRVGFPEWLGNLTPGARILEFTYVAPNIQVGIKDTFQVELDGASRTFVTSTTLATDGQQAAVTITGDMVGGWAKPFAVDWLTLDTVGLSITDNGTNTTAGLHSSFELGGKNVALDMDISGGASNQLVRFTGTVNTLSLSDFVDLAQKQLGPQAAPFGDSTFDFTFTNVQMSIETGTRSSFSLGGATALNGKPAHCLLSAAKQSGGGSPQIITGFEMQDWSLADALGQVKGTFVEDFRLQTVALIFSTGEGSMSAADMGPQTRAFYADIYGSGDFNVPFHNGLSLIGAVPLQGNPLQNGLNALGMSTDSIFLTGSIPGSIIGLGGGGGGLSGLSLVAALPPMSPPGSPDWFISGQVGLEITAQPSVGFVGDVAVKIQGQILTFDVSATIERVGASVEFALTGGLSAQQPWVDPFGIQWMTFNDAKVEVAVNELGSITLGFAGNVVIGTKDIDTAVAVTVTAAGVPSNFIFDGTSAAGVTVADLVTLQQQMARVDDTNAPVIPLDTMPDMAVRNMHLKFAPHSDPDLGVQAGFAVAGDLWIPSEAGGPPDREFAGINLSVDKSGIIAQGALGAFVLGPLTWSNAMCDLTLTLPTQQLVVSGAAQAGAFFQGDLNLGMTRSGLSFSTATTIYNQFQAQLEASASFSLTDPQFTVLAVLQNDFGGAVIPALTQKVKAEANTSTSLANNLLKRGLVGWTSFRNDPNNLNFASIVTGFANTAGWPSSDWSTYINAIQKNMNDIDNASPTTPDNLLDLALGGVTIPGVPGVKTRICILPSPSGCLKYQYFCNGVPYDGGDCWTVPPKTIGGACHDSSLSAYNIPCSSPPFIEQMLIPPLVGRMDTILQNANRSPMIEIENAQFTADLAGLTTNQVVTLATRLKFMQAATPLDLGSIWDFSNQDAGLNNLRDALVKAL